MTDFRQKKLKEKVSLNLGNLHKSAREAGYSESYAISGQIKKTKHYRDWQKMLDQKLSDKKLLKKHEEGLNAVKKEQKIVDRDARGNPVYDFVDIDDYSTRHKYLDSAYKLKDKYAVQKHQHKIFKSESELEKEDEDLAKEEEAIRVAAERDKAKENTDTEGENSITES